MRERHFQSGERHPRTCTCTECHRKRLQAIEEASRPKKKRKPKSQRGQSVSKKSSRRTLTPESQAGASQSALDEATRILGIESAGDDK